MSFATVKSGSFTPLSRTIVSPQGRKRRAHRGVHCNPLWQTPLPTLRYCRTDPWGVRPKGGVYAIYLPTPFTLRRHGDRAVTSRWIRVTVIDPWHIVRGGRFAEVMRLAPQSWPRVPRAHSSFPLSCSSGRLLRRLTRRLYDVALTHSVLCTGFSWRRNEEEEGGDCLRKGRSMNR